MDKRAFLIGINYIGTNNQLNGCINDVINVKNLLVSFYGYSEKNILVLTDNTPYKPTLSNIMLGFSWLLSSSPSSSFSGKLLPQKNKTKMYFHYSGHGSQSKDNNGDEIDGLDETLCPIDFCFSGMITDDIVRSHLAQKVPIFSELVAVIDACHSASSMDLLWNVKNTLSGTYTASKSANYTPTQGDVIVLSGCRDFETSADVCMSGSYQGALTHSLLQALKTNKTYTHAELLTTIRDYIKTNKLSSQVPCMSYGNNPNTSRIFSL